MHVCVCVCVCVCVYKEEEREKERRRRRRKQKRWRRREVSTHKEVLLQKFIFKLMAFSLRNRVKEVD